MIDWTTIIVAIISLTVGGSGAGWATYIIFRKQTLKKEDLNVIKEDASAAKEMLEFAKSMSDFKDSLISNLQQTIVRQTEVISLKDADYRNMQSEMDANKRKIQQLSITQSEHERKIKGITDILKQEIGKKQYAEHHICVDKDCTDRRPGLGTFKTENPKILE